MKTDKFNFHQIETKRIFVYLAIVFGVYYGLWLIAILLSDSAGNVIYSFLGFPIIFNTPIILRFGLLIVLWCSRMLWVRTLLCFVLFYFLTLVPTFSMASSMPEILSSISFIL